MQACLEMSDCGSGFSNSGCSAAGVGDDEYSQDNKGNTETNCCCRCIMENPEGLTLNNGIFITPRYSLRTASFTVGVSGLSSRTRVMTNDEVTDDCVWAMPPSSPPQPPLEPGGRDPTTWQSGMSFDDD